MTMNLSQPRLISFYTQIGRSLLAINEVDEEHNDHCAGHTQDHDIEEAFEHIYYVMLFMSILWFIGKLFARLGLPSLVGEIIVGIVMGPNLLNFVPYSDALVVIGEIGLVLLVLEAGIDVSIGHLKVVGRRGLFIAVFGSMLPLGIGTGLALLFGESLSASFAIGACLAPTSMGIALNVLRNAKVLNTPTGQLIIAAAVLDDVIALMLLSELEAMANPTWSKILLPLIVSPAFILFFGFLSIKVTPWLIQKVMIKLDKHQHENVILFLLFLATFCLIPICFYAGSSHLLGAFLAGLMFCTDHTIHSAWSNQIKRIMQWMLRVFFACTIGFAIPITDFYNSRVLIGGLLYFVAIIGKIATGIFAKPFGSFSEFFTIAFSMSAWGEFAFILATASYSTGSINKESYSSVLMAVLLSVIVSPLLLRITLSVVQHNKDKKLKSARDHDLDDNDCLHDAYFCVHTKGRGKWGHQDRLLHAIFGLNFEIIDFRAFNEAEYNYSHHLPITQDVFYVRDKTLSLPPTKRLSASEEKKLQSRYKEIKQRLKETMGDPHASVDVMRWLPGVRRKDDINSPKKSTTKDGAGVSLTPNQKNGKKKKKNPEYCRKAAYAQARMALDHVEAAHHYQVNGISRIRTSHDAIHRDKFTYHGGIHTEEDDLIAIRELFTESLMSLHESLSPINRASPTADSSQHKPLNNEELWNKINTLRNCAEHLELFKPTTNFPQISAPPSVVGDGETQQQHTQQHVTTSFDDHYANTFTLQKPSQSVELNKEKKKESELTHDRLEQLHAEHGSIRSIPHCSSTNRLANLKKAAIPPPPGMFVSHSHGHLPSHFLHGHGHHRHGHHHHHHRHGRHSRYYHKLSPEIYPTDHYQHHHNDMHTITSMSSVDLHHPHHPSTDFSDHQNNELSHSEDKPCDIMYGDEDSHHRPLDVNVYHNLDDLDEEDDEYDSADDHLLDNAHGHINAQTLKESQSLDRRDKGSKSMPNMKRNKSNNTWNRLKFKLHKNHKKLSDDDDNEHNEKEKLKKQRKLKKHNSKKWKLNKKNKEKSLSKKDENDLTKAQSHEAVPNGCTEMSSSTHKVTKIINFSDISPDDMETKPLKSS